MPVELNVDQEQLRAIGRRFKDEADGKQLKKDLATQIKGVAEPAAASVRAAITALQGVPTESKTRVASKTKVSVRLAGAKTGATVFVNKNAAPGFQNAARSFNSAGWRHKAWGRDVWFPQASSNPGFWDEEMKKFSPDVIEAVGEAVQDMNRRLAG